MKYTILLVVALIGCTSSNTSESQEETWLDHSRVEKWDSRTVISVSNPHDSNLENIPVTLPIKELKISGNNYNPDNFFVHDHQAGEIPLFQVDIPEGKELNEIVFLASLDAGQQKDYHIYYTENGQAWPKQERYTQATDMPGWESELYTYRSYGPLAIDLFARNNGINELMLHRFYNAGSQQIYNYHEESKFGLDILHLGSTAGLAGVGMSVEDEIRLVQGTFESEVVVSGPVRSIVQMNMETWKSKFGDVSISRRAIIYAHHSETLIEDHVIGAEENVFYAVGIQKADNAQFDMNEAQGLFLQWHNQGEDIGEAGIGLHLQSESVERVVEKEENHFILVQPPNNSPLRFWAFGAWKRGEDIENLSAFRQRAERIRQLQLPVQIKIGKIQHTTE